MSVHSIVADAGFVAVDSAVCFPPLAEALTVLRERDGVLLDWGAHERAVCHRLALYLEVAVNRDLAAGAAWDVDCEYNLLGGEPSEAVESSTFDVLRKYVPVQGRRDPSGYEQVHSVVPDIVVHRRGRRDNELVVEAKVVRGRPDRDEIEYDLRKLMAFADPHKGLAYRHALFVSIGPKSVGRASVDVFAPEGMADKWLA